MASGVSTKNPLSFPRFVVAMGINGILEGRAVVIPDRSRKCCVESKCLTESMAIVDDRCDWKTLSMVRLDEHLGLVENIVTG